MILIKPEHWIPQDIKLENAALRCIKSYRNTLIVAGPGAGKTELLAQRACFLLQTNTCPYPKRILAVSFKKDSASNLRDRVEKRCGKELAARFDSMTFDAFSKELLDRFILSLPQEYRPNSNYEIDTNGSKLARAYELCGYQRQSISLRNTKQSYPASVVRLLLNGDENNDFSPSLTFNLISRLVKFMLINNPLITKSLKLTYSHVFLDEFQDTTEVQYDLITTCFGQSNAILTAVGDGKQRIMSWAGAMQNAFNVFIKDFDAVEETLIINHRSAPTLIKLQKGLYKELNTTDIDIYPDEKWKVGEGIAELHYFNTDIAEAEYVTDKISSLLAKKVKPRDICILTKHSVENYSSLIIKKMNEHGIKIRNESLFQDLLKEDIVKILSAVLYCAVYDKNPDAWLYIEDIFFQIKGVNVEDKVEVINKVLSILNSFFEETLKKLDNIHGVDDDSKQLFVSVVNSIVVFIGYKALKDFFPQYQVSNYFDELVERFIDYMWNEYTKTSNWENTLQSFEGLDCVPVMTIHKSKGLEFDTVFIIGLEDNSFFSFASQKTEETCALFVAISRAKRELCITSVNNRSTLLRNAGPQTRYNIKPFFDAMKGTSAVYEYTHDS
jgi:superfamily I DNA/RNA helicase